MTKKEKLVRALLEERAGLKASDPNVQLLLEKEVDETEFLKDVDDAESVKDFNEDEFMDNRIMENNIQKESRTDIGIVGRAFGDNLVTAQVFVSDGYNATTKDEHAIIPSANLKMPIEGSALKRKSQEAIPVRKLKKPKKKGLKLVPKSESESENLSSDEEKSLGLWNSDVVSGEQTLATSHAVLPASKAVNLENSSVDIKPNSSDSKIDKNVKINPSYHVQVQRKEDIQIARMSLPVVAEEQPIMEAILANNVVILCGETGSGKTTQ